MVNTTGSLLPTPGSADRRGRHRRGRFHRQKPSQFEPGKWIWLPEPEVCSNTFIYGRKLFTLPAKPTAAGVIVTANSSYRLYVNGHYVGKGPVRRGDAHTYYDTFDLTGLLTRGKNVVAMLVHYQAQDSAPTDKPGMLCRLEATCGEEQIVVATDETWKVIQAADRTGQGARIGDGLSFQEVYDSGARLDDWNEVKFRERGWVDAAVAGSPGSMPWGRLTEREIPPLAEQKVLPNRIVGTYNSPERSKETAIEDLPRVMADAELAPMTAGTLKDVNSLLAAEGEARIGTPRGDRGLVIVLDFGREVFGNVEVGLDGAGSGLVDIGYGEALEEGRVKPNREGLNYTDRILLKKGSLHWQSFEPRAFRYLQIEFRWCTRQVSLEHVRVNETAYPVETRAEFECSDELLNLIWRAGANTIRLCMADTFMTSPWVEHGQWWGDARIESRGAYYAFDDTKLLAQGLRQIADTQRPDGSIAGMYPAIEGDTIPDYALLWVFSILDYYAFADDAELVRKLYPNARRLLEWFRSHSDDDELLKDVPGRMFIDHADVDKRGNVTALNCLYYQGLRIGGVLASIAGDQQDAEDIAAAAARLRIAINKHLFSHQRGLYADCRVDGKLVDKFSRQTNVLAALFDIPDHYQRSTICRQMLEGSLPQIATPYFMSYLLEVLYSADLHIEALDIIRRKWGPMVDSEATTLREMFSAGGSLCHGWSSCPTRDLLAEFVGIKPVLGSKRFSIAPRAGDLKWARGSVNTEFGPLVVDWRMGRDSMTIDVTVPQGLRVDVYPPGPSASKVTLSGKPQSSRLLTLGGGTYQIKVVAPRAEKPPKIEESLAPPPDDHVQVLGELYIRGRRRRLLPTPKRRGRGRLVGMRDVTGAETELLPTEAEVELAPEVEDFLSVEPIGEAAIEAQAEAAEAEEAEEIGPRSRRRRPRRSRKHTGVHTHPAEEAAAEPALGEQPEPPEAVEAEAEQTSEGAEPTEAVPVEKRRRSRRGRRRHGPAAATEEAGPTEALVEEPQPEPLAEPEAESAAEPSEEAAPAERRRRSRRGGRRHNKSRRAASEGETPAEVQAAEPEGEAGPEPRRMPPPEPQPSYEATAPTEPQSVPSEAEAPAGDAEAPSERKRRTRRGGRRHRSSAKRSEDEVAQQGEATAEPQNVVAAEERVQPEPQALAPAEAEPASPDEAAKPARKRRSSQRSGTRRRKQAETAEAPQESSESQPDSSE